MLGQLRKTLGHGSDLVGQEEGGEVEHLAEEDGRSHRQNCVACYNHLDNKKKDLQKLL